MSIDIYIEIMYIYIYMHYLYELEVRYSYNIYTYISMHGETFKDQPPSMRLKSHQSLEVVDPRRFIAS